MRASIAFCAVFAAFLSFLSVESDANEWRTGPEFKRQLLEPADVAWEQKPIREILATLSKHHRIAVMLDRRVNPDQMVPSSKPDLSLEDLLYGLANRLKLGVCFVGSVVYMGPVDATSKLGTLAELRKDAIRKMPDATQRELLRARPSQWGVLAEPRTLVEQIATQCGMNVEGLERVPHDLWAAASLPPSGFAERLTLVLAGFQLSFQFSADAKSVRLVSIPEEVSLQRLYKVSPTASGVVTKLRKSFPDAQFRREGQSLAVVGSAEDHAMIRNLLAGKAVRRKTVVASQNHEQKIKRFNVERKPLGVVLTYLADQLKLELTVEPTAKAMLEQNVTFTVEDATIEELFAEMLKPTGLTFRLEGKRLTVLAD